MQDDADIELAPEESRLQMKSHPDNYLCFRDNETYINLDLQVGGTITAGSLHVDAVEIGDDILVKGKVTVEGETDVQTLTAHEDANFDKLTAHEIITDDLTVQGKTETDTLEVDNGSTLNGLTANATSLGLTTTTALTTATLTAPVILSELITLALGFDSVVLTPFGINCIAAPPPRPRWLYGFLSHHAQLG
jgi:hypothetical protein